MSEEFKSTENSNQGDLGVIWRNENYSVIVTDKAEGNLIHGNIAGLEKDLEQKGH